MKDPKVFLMHLYIPGQCKFLDQALMCTVNVLKFNIMQYVCGRYLSIVIPSCNKYIFLFNIVQSPGKYLHMF